MSACKWRNRSCGDSMVRNSNLKLNKKSGFSLFEACVVMLVVSVFFAVSASVIPHRPKPKPEAEGHGRFECYYKGNTLYQQVFQGTSSSGIQQVAKCRFNPPVYAKYIVVNAVGGGAGGSGSNGGEPGYFYSSFHSSARAAFVTVPGKGGGAGVDGSPTEVFYENEEHKDPVVTSPGGKSNREWKDLTINDVKQCAITEGQSTANTNIACGSIPRCQIVGDKLYVSFCFSSTLYKSKYLDLQKDIIQRPLEEMLKPPEYNFTKNTITYHDQSLIDDYGVDLKQYVNSNFTASMQQAIMRSLELNYPPLFKMVLTFNLHKSNTVSPSLMQNYLEGMGITKGMGEHKHGQGGAPGGAGTNGAVIITW